MLSVIAVSGPMDDSDSGGPLSKAIIQPTQAATRTPMMTMPHMNVRKLPSMDDLAFWPASRGGVGPMCMPSTVGARWRCNSWGGLARAHESTSATSMRDRLPVCLQSR